ncbi:uncharacterized protein SCHCODRAFT_01266438 [Schizophyllum commune H4-8]|uniref:uncharacterized protein n=1 Tax=Schizophyllum commune (strain H4-8 / FGSC 9210) TaxID=578458 RepID=UPI00215FAD85|nr:uncharacterized protein SCHCODRAFT_01266438 [Schizophyllum commune H4-8]KAI5900424.1 hypothetical protein SCHCODRAFT_01266438 [Schizophyllum commune H4-8]
MSTPSTSTVSSTGYARTRRRRDPPMSAGQAAGCGSASGEHSHEFERSSALLMGRNECEGRLMSARVLGLSPYPYNLLLPPLLLEMFLSAPLDTGVVQERTRPWCDKVGHSCHIVSLNVKLVLELPIRLGLRLRNRRIARKRMQFHDVYIRHAAE